MAQLIFRSMCRKLTHYLPAMLWMLVIFLLSGDGMSAETTAGFFGPFLESVFFFLSETQVAFIHIGIRKAAHVVVYFLLFFFWMMAFTQNWKANGSNITMLKKALILSILYAVFDEYRQGFASTRSSSWVDVGWDSLGAIICFAWFSFRGSFRSGYRI